MFAVAFDPGFAREPGGSYQRAVPGFVMGLVWDNGVVIDVLNIFAVVEHTQEFFEHR